MNFTEHIIEYYDELYPITDDLIAFFKNELDAYPVPAKILSIECGTGLCEHRLAKCGFDITAIGAERRFIDTAVRRHRTPNAALRFFQMEPLDIGRFLAKNFYHCTAILDGFIYFIHDKTLLRKFLYDCKAGLVPEGRLIVHLPDMLQDKESPRVKLTSSIQNDEDGEKGLLTQTLERTDASGGIKRIPVRTGVPVYIPSVKELTGYAREAGFKDAAFYKAWKSLPVRPDEADIAVFS
ncbi:hypothetical protein V1L52_02380 [Treponema sp. HNW]|uniref:hypothetical protein n=1 Tax=Treponema sp. HNW TaxID=3116654 RepID=UPI003D10C466